MKKKGIFKVILMIKEWTVFVKRNVIKKVEAEIDQNVKQTGAEPGQA